MAKPQTTPGALLANDPFMTPTHGVKRFETNEQRVSTTVATEKPNFEEEEK